MPTWFSRRATDALAIRNPLTQITLERLAPSNS